jgi:hypothetical protein
MRYYKKVCFGILILTLAGCAGMQPLTDVDRTIVRVVEAPGYSKDQIFEGTKIWIAENFKSAKAVLEYENKDAGTIIGNGIIHYPTKGFNSITKGSWKVPFTMRVDIKDQKFCLTFSNLQLSWPPSWNSTFGAQPGHEGPLNYKDDLDAVRPELLKFGDQLLASLEKAKSKSNW